MARAVIAQRSRKVMDGLGPDQGEAWLRMGERIVKNMPLAEVLALFIQKCSPTEDGRTV